MENRTMKTENNQKCV